MSERDFTVTVRVTKTVYEYHRVTAESFDEARQKVTDGYGYVDDEDLIDSDREGIENVECCECGDEEGCCACGPAENENPDRELSPEDLEEGDWVEADDWTAGNTEVSFGPIRVIYIGGLDGDYEYSFEWEDAAGNGHHTYLPYSAGFTRTDDPTIPEDERKEREEERKLHLERMQQEQRVNDALKQLLNG